MRITHLSRTSSRSAILIGLLAVLLFIVLDVFVDCWLLSDGQDCTNLTHNLEPHRITSYLVGSGLILLLGLLSYLLLRRHENAETKLAHNSFLLEEMAIELRQKNAALSQEIALRKRMEAELETLVVTDPLTGIYNRRKFDEIINMHLRQENRYPKGLSLLILDIDHFKRINDSHGHAVGDEILKGLASLILQTKRDADDFFRIGGEEFALIAFSGDGSSLQTIADKLREEVANHAFPKVGQLTISIGATRFYPGDTYDSMFKRADDALYSAKEGGRNRAIAI